MTVRFGFATPYTTKILEGRLFLTLRLRGHSPNFPFKTLRQGIALPCILLFIYHDP